MAALELKMEETEEEEDFRKGDVYPEAEGVDDESSFLPREEDKGGRDQEEDEEEEDEGGRDFAGRSSILPLLILFPWTSLS